VDTPRSRGLAVHHPAGHPVDVDVVGVGVVGAAHGDRHQTTRIGWRRHRRSHRLDRDPVAGRPVLLGIGQHRRQRPVWRP